MASQCRQSCRCPHRRDRRTPLAYRQTYPTRRARSYLPRRSASARDDRQISRRELSRGFRSSWKHSPMRIADPFIMIVHIIGSLRVTDDSARRDRSDYPDPHHWLRLAARLGCRKDAARAADAVITAAAADIASTSRLENISSHSWRMTVRNRRNVILRSLAT
jgi:hypothetical protein